MNSGQNLNNIKKFIRLSNYISASQLFLRDNFLLNRQLEFKDIKPRLLGHWGSCPGVNHVYAHLINSQKKLDFAHSPLKIGFLLGSGHAFPSLQANLLLEGTLSDYYPEIKRNISGIADISRKFSSPGGFPSHSSPFTPSVISEGGELGYSLSTAFGAVLDNPNLILATLIGDGEAETGPLSAAWQLNKLVNPIDNGVVLPILHLNKYKISGPTLFGSMSDFELIQFFHGAGWEPKIVDEYVSEDFDKELSDKFEDVVAEISRLKLGINKGDKFIRLPLLIIRNKKGSSGVKEFNGEKIEGSYLSHQVPLPKANSDQDQLKALEAWLRSYDIEELIDVNTGEIKPWIDDFLGGIKIGKNSFLQGGEIYKDIKCPEDLSSLLDESGKSLSMNAIGNYLQKIFELNNNFKFFSPDETYSNKLDAIFKQTSREWQRSIKPWEKDLNKKGGVFEILSEHSLQGMLQGYVLTGRHGVMTSYEAFAVIIDSMVDQYAKFLIQSKEVSWRKDISSLNYILTSTGWRQDHNGFSHQNPGFIDEVLRRENGIGQVFLPADDSQALVYVDDMLKTRNNINVLVAGKTDEPRFFNLQRSNEILQNKGVFYHDLWVKFSETDNNPDIVLAASGDYMFKEMVAAAQVLAHDFEGLKIRIVYVSILSSEGIGKIGDTLTYEEFDNIFTEKCPVFFAFHGYVKTIKSILFDYISKNRIFINGYREQGSTTTPFDMLARNKVSRYDIAQEVTLNLPKEFAHSLEMNKEYIRRRNALLDFAVRNTVDPPELERWVYPKFY